MTTFEISGLPVWIGLALAAALSSGFLAGRHCQFSPLSFRTATVLTVAMLWLILSLLGEAPENAPLSCLLQLTAGAVLWQVAGLFAAGYARPRLALAGVPGNVLAWAAGMTLAWALAVMTLLLTVNA